MKDSIFSPKLGSFLAISPRTSPRVLSPILIFFNFLTKVFLINLSRFSFPLRLVQAIIPPNDLSDVSEVNREIVTAPAIR